MSKYVLSRRSLRRLTGVDQQLIDLVTIAITRTPIDFGIAYLGGLRTEQEQNQLFRSGVSKKDGIVNKSRHQYGEAVDLIVFVNGVVVDDMKMLSVVAGVMFSCASEMGITIRWGGDWDRDGDMRDNNFNDLFHFELIK